MDAGCAFCGGGKNELSPLVATLDSSKTSPLERNFMTVEATNATFDSEVLETEGKVIVDFWAEWCGPCHAVAPVLDRIADEHDIKIVKVDIDHEQGLAQRYGVASIPMMVLFENGEPQASAIGAMPKGALERSLGLSNGDGN